MNRRQKEQIRQRRERSRQRYRRFAAFEREATPKQIRKVINRFAHLKPGFKALLYCRVSKNHQYRRGNAKDQEENLRREVAEAGGIVVDVVTYVGKGSDPERFRESSKRAGELGAVLIAEETDRLVRNEAFHPYFRPHVKPTLFDLQQLKKLTKGIRLYTLEEPGSSLGENRSRQTKRGMKAKNRMGGRPRRASRKKRREECRQLAINTYKPGITSFRSTARIVTQNTGIPVSHSTIKNWIEEEKAPLLRG